jgi:hypothetical protein
VEHEIFYLNLYSSIFFIFYQIVASHLSQRPNWPAHGLVGHLHKSQGTLGNCDWRPPLALQMLVHIVGQLLEGFEGAISGE